MARAGGRERPHREGAWEKSGGASEYLLELRRASLYRVLREMEDEGLLELEQRGEGTRRNRYRKLPAAPPASASPN